MNCEIKTYSEPDLAELFASLKLPKFRVGQVLEWLYGKGVQSYDEMTNLPKTLREQLANAFPLNACIIVDRQVSKDGTRKYIIEYHDGSIVEAVGLPYQDGRFTICCSSQAGCAMNCAFCATGKSGFRRNLLPGEIIDQLLLVSKDFGKQLTNVVVMGQGEPFSNYDNTIAALGFINNPKLLNIGARHITVSTCGIIPGIEKFSNDSRQFTLAVSLHSAIQEKRKSLMPIAKTYPLELLRKALISYSDKTNRRFSFEYAMIKGVNDSGEDLEALIAYARGLLCHVNLIPLNEIPDSEFHPSPRKNMELWSSEIEKAGISATIRHSMGSDIAGACGQLANSRI